MPTSNDAPKKTKKSGSEMPQDASAAPKPASKRKPAVKPAAPPEPPFLRFYHSAELRAKTLHVLTTIEQAQDATRYRGALADLIMELTDSGLDYYFMRPLHQAKVNFVVTQSANMGMGSVKRVMSPVIHNVLGRMNEAQLLGVCAYLRELMV